MNFSLLGQSWSLKTDIVTAELCEKKRLCPRGRRLSQIIDSFAVSVDDAKLSEEPLAESRAARSTVERFVPVVTNEGLSITHWFARLWSLNDSPFWWFALSGSRWTKKRGHNNDWAVNLISVHSFILFNTDNSWGMKRLIEFLLCLYFSCIEVTGVLKKSAEKML